MGSEFWSDSEKLGGNADVFENKGVAKKGICKWMKTHGMQIDGVEGATHKFLKTRIDSRTADDNAETRHGGQARRTRRRRRGTRYPTPPVFCEKRLQAIENKGKEWKKERQEISRGGKLLKR